MLIKEPITVKKRIGNIIDIANNEKVKSSKGYEYWATKHNLKTAADTIYLFDITLVRHFLHFQQRLPTLKLRAEPF